MRDRLFLTTALAASIALGMGSSVAMAATTYQLPGQGRVVAGQVSVSDLARGRLSLQVSGPSVINWGSGSDIRPGAVAGFNIGPGARVDFNGSNRAAVLNIDSSGRPSQIFGALNASGTDVFVANRNGIVIGARAQIASDRMVGLIANRLLPGAAAGFDGSGGSIAYDGSGGDVTVRPGARFAGGGRVLIAGGGNVNVDLGAFGGPLSLRAGRAAGGTDNAAATLTVSGQQRGPISGFNVAGTATNTGTLALAHATVDGKLINQGTLDLADGFAISGKLVNAASVRARGDATVGRLDNRGDLGTGGAFTARGGAINSGRIVGLTDTASLRVSGTLTNRDRIENMRAVSTSGGDLVNDGSITLRDSAGLDGAVGSVAVSGGNLINGGSIASVRGADGTRLYKDLEVTVTNGDVRNSGLLTNVASVSTGSDAQAPKFRDDGDYSIINSGTIRGSFAIDANFYARGDGNHSSGSFSNTGTLDLRAASSGAERSLQVVAHNDVALGGRVLGSGQALGAGNALDGVSANAYLGRLTLGTPLVFRADGRNSGAAYLSGRQVYVAADVIGLGQEAAIYLTADRRSDGSYAYSVSPGVKFEASDVYFIAHF